MRIGYLLQYEHNSEGAAAPSLHIKAVTRGLERRGHQVRMVALQGGQPCWTDDLSCWHPASPSHARGHAFRLMERGVRGLQARLRLPYFNLFDSDRFSRACDAALAGCDVLYERYWLLGFGGLMAAKRMGIPLVLEVNGDIIEEYRQQGIQLSRPQWMAIHAMNRWLFRGAGHVVAVSEPLRRRTIQRWGLNPQKVTAVPNGADLGLFGKPPDVLAPDSRLDIKSGQSVVFVGSFQPWHGLDLLIAAFQQVVGDLPEAQLVLVGDGPLRSEMEEKVATLGLGRQVVFTGEVSHPVVAEYLNMADVAVLSPVPAGASIYQSPLKLFEYMASGKAVVAPAMPNIAPLVTDGVDVLLVPPGDSGALARSLCALLRDSQLRSSLGAAARKRALREYSWDSTAAKLEIIMTGLLNGRRGTSVSE